MKSENRTGSTIPAELERTEAGRRDVANLGVLRPPFVYLAAILGGVAIDFVQPVRFLPDEVGTFIEIPIMIAALVLFFQSVGRFRAAGTPVPGNKPATAIVRVGPYRWSRNPIYLAFSILQVGVACSLNSLWVLTTLAAAWGLMTLVVIPREERYLERKFGSEYLEYKATVRRWM